MLRVALAALHLIALGVGLGAVLTRGNALREPVSSGSLHRALSADTVWGIAAALWVITGLWRLFGATEKPTSFYTNDSYFIVKMALFVLIVALEVWPMMMLLKWRRSMQRSALTKDIVVPATARRIAMISHIEALLVVLMVIAAAAMARGYGLTPGLTQ
jgi:putative membrane protein